MRGMPDDPAEVLPPREPEPIHPDRLYTVAEAAGFLGLHPDSVYRMGHQKRIRVSCVGPSRGRRRIRGRDLLEYLEESAA